MKRAVIILAILAIFLVACAKAPTKQESVRDEPLKSSATALPEGKIDIAAVSITTSSPSFEAGDRLTIYPVVRNLGQAINGVEVGLYANSKLLNMYSFDFKAQETKGPIYTWYPDTAGDYEIKIIVDPNKKLDETNTNNNEASRKDTIY